MSTACEMLNTGTTESCIRHNTKWSFEVPIYNMEDFEEEQDFNFALIHLCKDRRYVKYLKKSKLATVLDNSYNELGKPCSVSTLAKIAQEVGAYKAVSPDCHLWDMGTALAAFEALKKELPADISILYVVHNEAEFAIALSANEGGNIAAPGRWRHRMYPGILRQIDHFLGFNYPLEVQTFHPDSIDTGMPVKLAMQGKTLDTWLREGCQHIHNSDLPTYFSIKMNLPQVRLAKKNIRRLKEVCFG